MKKLWGQYSYAIILICLSFFICFIISIQSSHEDHYLKIKVSEGDSLWKIADNFSKEHSLSKVEFVNWVEKHNDIQGDRIFPGEKIVIPVEKKDDTMTEFASAER
ncbi:MAG: LysM peptidoglycan-binding domain-containing protein [Bacillota bacterium]|nr:LysM peptidoglycan-binding domain-containing protein [Bacillota bacterium]